MRERERERESDMAGLVRPDSKAELTPTEVAVNPVIYRPEILGQ